VDQREREREPPLQAGRIQPDLTVREVLEPEELQEMSRPIGDDSVRNIVEGGLDLEVLPAGHCDIQARRLERDAQQPAHPLHVARGDIMNSGGPSGGPQKTGEHVERGRFAGAVRSNDRHDLPRRRMQVDALRTDHPRGIHLRQVRGDDCAAGHLRGRRRTRVLDGQAWRCGNRVAACRVILTAGELAYAFGDAFPEPFGGCRRAHVRPAFSRLPDLGSSGTCSVAGLTPCRCAIRSIRSAVSVAMGPTECSRIPSRAIR